MKVLGQMIAHSIAQDGVGFPYLSPVCFWYLVGGVDEALPYVAKDDVSVAVHSVVAEVRMHEYILHNYVILIALHHVLLRVCNMAHTQSRAIYEPYCTVASGKQLDSDVTIQQLLCTRSSFISKSGVVSRPHSPLARAFSTMPLVLLIAIIHSACTITNVNCIRLVRLANRKMSMSYCQRITYWMFCSNV